MSSLWQNRETTKLNTAKNDEEITENTGLHPGVPDVSPRGDHRKIEPEL